MKSLFKNKFLRTLVLALLPFALILLSFAFRNREGDLVESEISGIQGDETSSDETLASSTISPSTTEPTESTPETTTAESTPEPTPTETTLPEPTAAPEPPAPTTVAKPETPSIDENGIDEKWLAAFLNENKMETNQLGLVYVDLTTGERYEHNPDGRFVAASTIKVPMAMYTYDQIHAGRLTLDTELSYRSDLDFESGAGSLQFTIQDGDTVTVDEALRLAIQQSDNIATNLIFRYWREQPESMSLTARMNQAFSISYDGKAHVTSRDLASVLERLYRNEQGNPYYLELIELMKHTTFNSYATERLPAGSFAHKYGLYAGYTNDIGIVFGDRPYVFSIFASGLSDPNHVLSELGWSLYIAAQK